MTALERLNEDERKEYWACLALKYAQNIGVRTIAKLLKHFNSAFVAVHSLSEWGKIGASHRIKHIQDNSWREEAKKEWENARDLDAEIVLWNMPSYPPLLKEIPDPPSYFYAKGKLELMKVPSLGIVGSRDSSKDGQNESAYIAKTLSNCGVCIISGMARGIDRAAHQGALQGIGSSIGVLGSGIDVIYPSKNNDIYFKLREEGLLISEFAPGLPPDPTNFPIRNRIISALSYGVLVIEADIKSGSLITARVANEQGRQVYAIPGAMGSPFSKGCQELIRQGAKSVFRPEDILEDLLPLLRADLESLQKNIDEYKINQNNLNPQNFQDKAGKAKNEEQTPLIQDNAQVQNNLLQSFDKQSIEYSIVSALNINSMQFDDLCQELGKTAQELTVALTLLELGGTIKRLEGAWFEINS